MDDLEANDPAWDLLENARKTDISPVFAQDVLREVRLLDDRETLRSSGIAAWFSFRWASVLAGAAALVVGIVLVSNHGVNDPKSPSVSASTGAVEPVTESAEYEQEISIEEFADELEELAYLSELMEVPDTSLLLDEDLAALLF